MSSQFRAVVAGLICVDLSPTFPDAAVVEPGGLQIVGPMRLDPGGCVANTGGDLAALGASVRLVGSIGSDALGTVLARMLADRGDGATLSLSPVPGAATSYTIVVQPPEVDRTLWHHVGANAKFDGSGIDLADADLLHVGYPPLLPGLLADDARPLRAVLDRARQAGLTTSLDLAVEDSARVTERPDWTRLLPELLPLVDVLTPSVDDLASMLHRRILATPDGLAEAAADLLAWGVGVTALSAGVAGITLRTANRQRLADGGRVLAAVADTWADRTGHVPAVPVPAVRTTGAGDAATAGLLYGLLEGISPEEALALAAATAASHVRGEQTPPPYRASYHSV
ncbi:MAG: PfkB family carbohydrate kinase [Frankiaceae bacterium]